MAKGMHIRNTKRNAEDDMNDQKNSFEVLSGNCTVSSCQ